MRKKRFNKWLEKWHEEQPHAVDLCNAGGGAYPPELFQEKCEVVFPSGMPAPRPSCQGLSLISATVLRPELRGNKEIEHFRDSEKNGNALAVELGIFAHQIHLAGAAVVARRYILFPSATCL